MHNRSRERNERPRPRRLVLWLPTLVPPLWWIWVHIEARGSAGVAAVLATTTVVFGFSAVAFFVEFVPAAQWVGPDLIKVLANTYFLALLGQFLLLALLLATAVWLVPPRLKRERVCRACLYPLPNEPDERSPRCPECGNAWYETPRPPWRRGFNQHCGATWSYERTRGPAALALSTARVVGSFVLIVAVLIAGRSLAKPIDAHFMNMSTPTLRKIATGEVGPRGSPSNNVSFYRTAAFGLLALRQDLSVSERLRIAMELDPDFDNYLSASHAVQIPNPSSAIADLLVMALERDELSPEAEARFFGPFAKNLSIDPPTMAPSGALTGAHLVYRQDPDQGVPFGNWNDMYLFFEPTAVVLKTNAGERELPATTHPFIGTRRLHDRTSPSSVNVNALFPNAAPMTESWAFENGKREWLVHEIPPAAFAPGERCRVIIRGTVFAVWGPGQLGIGPGPFSPYAIQPTTPAVVNTTHTPTGRLWEREVRIEQSFVVPGAKPDTPGG